MNTMVVDNFTFEEIDKSLYSSLYFNASLKMAICVADQDYIPIKNFKQIFVQTTLLSEQFEIKHFVFDKRKLRTFHQPSMEWYFSVWKPAMRDKGLVSHFKLLPEMEWFVKAVEAGKHEIYQKFGKDIVNGISIDYVNTLEEAIQKVPRTKDSSTWN